MVGSHAEVACIVVKHIRRKTKKLSKFVKHVMYRIRRAYIKKKIKSRDFTVVSNNCWAGKLYQYLDMPYLSPTVGLYFFTDDYLKFIKNLQHYMSLDLKFISITESKHKEILIRRNQEHVPIALLDDVEIIFLHYATKEDAEDKWNRRKRRINWNHIIIKFSRMNGCTEEHLREFSELSCPQKFILNNRKQPQYTCEYYLNTESDDEGLLSDTNPFPGNLCLSKIII